MEKKIKINHAWLENATISLTKTERKRQEKNIERVKKNCSNLT